MAGDGALGTMLLARRPSFRGCLEELNLAAPEEVRRIHEEYLRAGAEIVQTNTFGANAVRLAEHGLSGLVEAVNCAGVKLAREAAVPGVLVAGSVGPLGHPLGSAPSERKADLPPELINPRRARSIFRDQMQVLADSGVDLILLETFADLDELGEALAAARELGRSRVPLVAQVTVDGTGRMLNGSSLAEVTRSAAAWGADVIGCNCSEGPPSVLAAIETMAASSDRPLSAQPSAGLPGRREGRAQPLGATQRAYPYAPEEFAEWAERLIIAGALIVGGCCGTAPDHIRSVREVVEKERGRRRQLLNHSMSDCGPTDSRHARQ